MMEAEGQKLFTVAEAAERAGITEQAIRNAIYRGKLATVTLYGRVLIKPEEFAGYRARTRRGRPKKANA